MDIRFQSLRMKYLLEPAPQGMGAPQSIETDIMTVLASLNPLPTTPPLPRSAQEHAGAVYAAPIPTSQNTNQHSDFGPVACLSQNSRTSLNTFPRAAAHGYTRNREVYRWFRLPETLSTHLRVGSTYEVLFFSTYQLISLSFPLSFPLLLYNLEPTAGGFFVQSFSCKILGFPPPLVKL